MAVGQISEQDGYIVIALDGEIDLETAPAVRKALLENLKKGRNLLIDLAKVSYIDSSGIASLVEGLQVARKQGNDLALVSVSQRAHRVLELARLDKVFTLHADLASALRDRTSGTAST
ncbi:MAG TPA: STAS domain-containing protein [Dongiaceae bacterium]|nr:STAS domain-containing protein [Dongiaceae bacterium]